VEALRVAELQEYLNAAGSLLRLLDQAQLLGATAAEWQGAPVRLLKFKLTPTLREKDKKYIKQLDATASLWIGADGLPVAAETRVYVKGRAFLVISFESDEREQFQFARAGDRLVTLRHVRDARGSGGGESHAQQTTATLQITP
jgi:hypothetical protein